LAPRMENLDLLLTHELNQSMRHRRYFSLAMVCLNETGPKLASLLQRGMRESDSKFFSDDVAIVVMGETTKTGAVTAVNRYRDEFCERFDVRSSISSFPDDGKAPEELMNVLERRLKSAMELDRGAVVAQ
jgi:hypothetical protein